MEKRVEELSELQDALDVATELKAQELAEKMALVDQAHHDAEEAKKRTIRRSRAEVEAAKQEANLLRQKVREELADQVAKAEASRVEVEQAQRAFELEKRRVVKRTVRDIAKATVRVLTGVFTGTIRHDPERSSFAIEDRDLAKTIDDYGIKPYLEKPVMVIHSVWQKVSSLLPRFQVVHFEQDLKEKLAAKLPPFDQGG